ncbi:MAG TPA: hypothetical protein VNC50_22655, partial [Planctomycetia bacterium]|nr:hypothetical protein [Planctomycetia bacterium]
LASAGGDKKVRLINAENGQEQTTLYGAEGPLYCVAFNHDGNYVAAGGWDGAVRIWSTMDGTSVAALRKDPEVKRDILSIAYSGDDSKIVTGSDDGGVRVWNVKDRTETAVFRGHDRSVTCVAYAEDGTLIISSSRDGSVRMWDPATIEGLQN